MSGRLGRAPCGHAGECVIGQFYRCTEGCADDSAPSNGVPEEITLAETTELLCVICGSSNLTHYPNLHVTGQDAHWCMSCGHVFYT